MRVVLSADDRFWLAVPEGLSATQGQARDEWSARVVDDMRLARGDAWTPDMHDLALAAVDRVIDSVESDDVYTLLFWPRHDLASCIVHIQVGRHDLGEAGIGMDQHTSIGAAVNVVQTASLGEGVEVRFFQEIGATAQLTACGIYYYFEGTDWHMLVWSDMTVASILVPLARELRELVENLHLSDEERPVRIASLASEARTVLAEAEWPSLVPTGS